MHKNNNTRSELLLFGDCLIKTKLVGVFKAKDKKLI